MQIDEKDRHVFHRLVGGYDMIDRKIGQLNIKLILELQSQYLNGLEAKCERVSPITIGYRILFKNKRNDKVAEYTLSHDHDLISWNIDRYQNKEKRNNRAAQFHCIRDHINARCYQLP